MDGLELIFAATFVLDIVMGYRVYLFLKKHLFRFINLCR